MTNHYKSLADCNLHSTSRMSWILGYMLPVPFQSTN